MRVVGIILATGAIIAAFIGLSTLSQATQGVGFIGLACFAGILARIAQASGETDRLLRALNADLNTGVPRSVAAASSGPISENDIACPSCGARNVRGPATCSSCGASLRGALPA